MAPSSWTNIASRTCYGGSKNGLSQKVIASQLGMAFCERQCKQAPREQEQPSLASDLGRESGELDIRLLFCYFLSATYRCVYGIFNDGDGQWLSTWIWEELSLCVRLLVVWELAYAERAIVPGLLAPGKGQISGMWRKGFRRKEIVFKHSWSEETFVFVDLSDLENFSRMLNDC